MRSPLSFFFVIIKLKNIFLRILLQDIYNVGVLTVNMVVVWLGTKRMKRLATARFSPVSKPRHIHSIFTVNTQI
jgi:ribosomal protein L23